MCVCVCVLLYISVWVCTCWCFSVCVFSNMKVESVRRTLLNLVRKGWGEQREKEAEMRGEESESGRG